MRRLLREPLLHFLLLGAAIFALHGWWTGPGAGPVDRIVVSETDARRLAAAFERTWMRPPTAAELRRLVDDHVTEEALYREALALGLDRDDLVVRRRMRQKLEFLNDGLTERDPSESELQAFLEASPDRYHREPRVSFEQLFVSPDGDTPPESRAAALLASLRGRTPTSRLSSDDLRVGDPTLLPREMRDATSTEIAGRFGPEFAEAVAAAPSQEWSGPVPSSFGLHLVRVSERTPGGPRPLDEVRRAVARDWAAEQRRQSRERFYGEVRSRYEIEVQLPDLPMERPAADLARQP